LPTPHSASQIYENMPPMKTECGKAAFLILKKIEIKVLI